MWVKRKELSWLKEHARHDGETWRCKTTGKPVEQVDIGRSIWVRPFPGGFGEVRLVAHLFCSGCAPQPTLPGYGDPIYEDELVETA